MSSTFLNIRKNKSLQSFKSRLSHNMRKSNLKSGPVPDEAFINIISIDRREKLNKILESNKVEITGLTKTQLSKQISRLRDRIKNSKKESTKAKNEIKLSELLEQRENTAALKVGKPQNTFFEIDMSITSVDKKLLRDENYAKDFLSVYQEYIEKTLKNAAVIGLVAHLDQGNPHCHVNLVYTGDDNITSDLENAFCEGKNYLQMQKDFNEFVKNHTLLKKYDLDINVINKDGVKEYKDLATYKLQQEKNKKIATKQVNKFLEKRKGYDKDKLIKDLTTALTSERADKLYYKSIPKYFENLEKEYNELKNENSQNKDEAGKYWSDNHDLANHNTDLKDKNENLQQEIKELKNEQRELKQQLRENNHMDIDFQDRKF